MKSKYVVILFIFVSIQQVTAYPITPRPLRKLIIESENIVFASVIRVENVKSKKTYSHCLAVLSIKETLKGSITQKTIKVYFNPNMICPAPAVYIEGTTVLAFLNKQEDKKYYRTHALSYGTKTINENDFRIYKERISEMQEILQVKDEEEKIVKTIDWLVTCATHPATREEGVYELSPESNFMSYYDRDRDLIIRRYHLSDAQRRILRNALLLTVTLSYSDIGLIDLVGTERDMELFDFLTLKLKEMSTDKLWFAGYLMSRIAAIGQRSDLTAILSAIEKVDLFDKEKEKKIQDLIEQFISKI